MEFQVLGPLQVTHAGQEVFVGAAYKPRLVLAVLLARGAGQTVSVDQLVTTVWNDSPPASARRNIQLYVHRLRSVLGNDRIIRQPGGYTIVTGDGLDSTRFRRLAAEGSRTLDADPARAGRILRDAIDLWRGPAFAEFGDCEPISEEAAQLEQLRLVTHERWAEAELALGRHGELIGELTRLALAHPYHEGLRAHLMVALNRSGRQAEALEVFQQTRALLHEQLGVEPGPALQRLHQDILRGDDRPPAPERAAPATTATVSDATRTTPPVPRELPTNIPGFIGREDAFEALDRMLPGGATDPITISAITGMGGVGKTALAVRWAHRVADRFPDGQLYLNLRGYSPGAPVHPADALAGFLRALGVSPGQVPVEATEAAARYRSLMAGRRILILLDNASSAEQVRPLVPGNAGCAVLVTSRDRLTGLVVREGAQRITLDTLAPAETEALFGHLLGANRVRAEPEAVARLGEVCAHLPLALRIAAARLLDRPNFPIRDYVTELGTGSPVNALTIDGDEETAVRATFDLSYRLLPEHVRRIFRRLGPVASPDFTPAAAAALADVSEQEAAAALDRLTDVHLVDQHGPGRFTVHDLLRRYADDLSSAEDGEEERTKATGRLFEWYLSMAGDAAKVLYPDMLQLPAPDGIVTRTAAVDTPATMRTATVGDPAAAQAAIDDPAAARTATVDTPATPRKPAIDNPAAAMAWLSAEHHNVVAAIDHAVRHGPRPMAWLLADRLRGYHNFSRRMVDWLATGRAALAAAHAERDRRAMASAFLNLAHAYHCLARYNRSIAYLNRAVALSHETGWTQGEASALSNLSTTFMFVGLPDEATRPLSRALELHDRLGSEQTRAKILNNLANACRQSGRLREGLDHAVQALTLIRETSAPRAEAVAMTTIGELHHQLGHLAASADHLTTALARHRELGDRYLEADTLAWLALVRRDSGRLEQAHDTAEAALGIAVDIGDRFTEVQAMNTLASIRDHSGNPEEALRLHRTALGIAREINARHLVGEALLALGITHHRSGDHTAAADLAEQALELVGEPHFRVVEGRALTVLAYACHRRGLLTEAEKYGRRALDNHRATGHRMGEAQTWVVLSAISHDNGDTTTAETQERLATELYAEIGAPFSRELTG
ncbi:BTAD domain-containing putative transcriptional regulator [Streptosporangium sp. NPDC050280]|uniref:AfsR/SARP family transcriptional regulator n=1 Tax=unclassified Streptosporangium TaxID=2632669 RepID=UPI00343D3053